MMNDCSISRGRRSSSSSSSSGSGSDITGSTTGSIHCRNNISSVSNINQSSRDKLVVQSNCTTININGRGRGRGRDGGGGNGCGAGSSIDANNNAKNKKLFPKKLWDLINNEKYHFCLRWSDDGQLVYLNRDEFEDSYLKTPENQFHTQKAISFVRQMNMYGFRKVDDCYYENDNFKRDCENHLKNMIRKHPNKNHLRNHHLNRHHHHHHQDHTSQHLNNQQLNGSGDLVIPKQLLLNMKNSHGMTSPTAVASASGIAHQSQQPLQPINDTLAAAITDNNDSDLRTFYALLSSMSNNFYNSQLFVNDQGTSLFDSCNLPNEAAATLPQQIYQTFLAQQQQQQQLDAHRIASSSLNYLDLTSSSSSTSTSTTTTTTATPKTDSIATKDLCSQPEVTSPIQLTKGITSTPLSQTSAISFLTPAKIYSSSSSSSSSCSSSSSSGSSDHCNKNNIASDLSIKDIRNCKHLNTASLIATSLDPHDLGCSSLGDVNSSNTNTKSRSSSGSHLQHKSNRTIAANEVVQMPIPLAKRKDHRMIRSFKRSVDSILDSSDNDTNETSINNNRGFADGIICPSLVATSKRMKHELYHHSQPDHLGHQQQQQQQQTTKTTENIEPRHQEADCLVSGVNEFAKNLVSEIALSRDAHIDSKALLEASKYTEGFVQTLFDTALVIARHSNGLNLSDYIIAADHTTTNISINKNNNNCQQVIAENAMNQDDNDRQDDQSNISVSDLTSALKLLPSKLLKILQ